MQADVPFDSPPHHTIVTNNFASDRFQQLGKSRTAKKTTNRLRMRKGRSVMHNNLEDNYGAVIVANHEALAQVLDQVRGRDSSTGAVRASCSETEMRRIIFVPRCISRYIFRSHTGNNNCTFFVPRSYTVSFIVYTCRCNYGKNVLMKVQTQNMLQFQWNFICCKFSCCCRVQIL